MLAEPDAAGASAAVAKDGGLAAVAGEFTGAASVVVTGRAGRSSSKSSKYPAEIRLSGPNTRRIRFGTESRPSRVRTVGVEAAGGAPRVVAA